MDSFLERLILNLVGPVSTVALAAVIGQRLSARWAERQKRRELELALANSFYASYGEFCAIWKLWNRVVTEGLDSMNEVRRDLLDRACKAEGTLEAVLLKIAAERHLNPDQQKDLGNLRQAYQVLRERIEERITISYGYSDHPDYLEFKRLATLIGVLLAKPNPLAPSPQEAFEAFREITHNRHEPRWRRAGRS
jgi:hypothetical protein